MELPQLIDPMECLEQQKVLEGSIISDQLPRLKEMLSEPAVQIDYKLTFSRDEHGRCIVHCNVTACFNLTCQRCAQLMEFPVRRASLLCVIADDKLAESLPERFDPLVAVEGMVSLHEVIEEELLLAIPMIPRHERKDCSANLPKDLIN